MAAYVIFDVGPSDRDAMKPYLEKAFRMSGKLTEKDRRHIVAWYAIANQDYQTAIRRYFELIAEYPFCFRAKVPTFDDLLVSAIEICLRKR